MPKKERRQPAEGAVATWCQALMGAVILFFISQLGAAFKENLTCLVRFISGGRLEPIQDSSAINAIWLGIIGVHAAVGALAPILGYTLLTTNITSASRIAPAGGVVALEIKWEKYLRLSLALLVSSILGVIFAPSALGLLAALLATSYVILKTGLVFKQGFDLIERPERYDASARKYLVKVVKEIKLASPSVEQKGIVELLSSELTEHIQRLPKGMVVQSRLRLGSPFTETELIRYSKGAIEALASEAASLGCVLYLMRESVSHRLGRGRFNFLAVAHSEQVAALEEAPQVLAQRPVDQSSVDRLQKRLEASIFYQTTQDTEDLARMPLLVMRHVAAVVQEALPSQRPHDVEYGLDVLGQIIDQLTDSHGANAINSDRFRWIYDIPAFVSNQMMDVPHSRMMYVRLLVSFIRNRMITWLNDEQFDHMSKAYMALLGRILRSSVVRDPNAPIYEIVVIREIPILARVGRSDAVIIIVRELIMTFVDRSFAGAEFGAARRNIIKSVGEVIRFSGNIGESVRAETKVAGLAVALFMADQDDSYKSHVEEIIREMIDGQYDETSFADVISVLQSSEALIERWRLDWWELEQKGSGAHWISMSGWVLRASAVAINHFSWRLSYLDDGDLPSEDVLTSVGKEIDNDEWLELLPNSVASSIRNLRKIFPNLKERRRALVEARVVAARVSEAKVREFVLEQMDSIKSEFISHDEWLRNAGSIEYVEGDRESGRSGVSRLVPKDSFVSDDVVDIPVKMLADNLGRLLVDFELIAIARSLFQRSEDAVRVDSVSDGRIWAAIDDFIGGEGVSLLILGVGAGFYEHYSEVTAIQKKAEASNKSIRFESIREEADLSRAIIIAEPSTSFALCRREISMEEQAVYREQLRLHDGGVVSDVIEIDEGMRERWIGDVSEDERKEMTSLYERSVVARTLWSFSVMARDGSFKVYLLPPDED